MRFSRPLFLAGFIALAGVAGRELGVAANATPRQFRGIEHRHVPLSLLWMLRRQDTHDREQMPKSDKHADKPTVKSR